MEDNDETMEKSDNDPNKQGCSSGAYKDELIYKGETDLVKIEQPGLNEQDKKMHVKEELCASIWSCLRDYQENVQENKSQFSDQTSQLVEENTFSETLPGQAGNLEQIKEEMEDSDIIDGKIDDNEETTQNINLYLPTIAKFRNNYMDSEKHELTEQRDIEEREQQRSALKESVKGRFCEMKVVNVLYKISLNEGRLTLDNEACSSFF